MSHPISDLQNVNRLYIKALERTGVDSLEKLCNLTYEELKTVKGLGLIGKVEVIRALNNLGMALKKECHGQYNRLSKIRPAAPYP